MDNLTNVSGFSASRRESSGGSREIYGTLRREGIKPIGNNISSGSSKVNKNDIAAALSYRYNLLENGRWLEIGDGWHQITLPSSGSISRCGLHSVLDARNSAYYGCIYVPRNPSAYHVATSANPCYDLQVQLKYIPCEGLGAANPAMMKNTTPRSSSSIASNNIGNEHIHVIFGYQHPGQYYVLSCDFLQKTWSVMLYSGDDSPSTILQTSADPAMKPHHFYTILIQIRGAKLSIDINSSPVFTGVKTLHDLSGLMGLAAYSAKCAIKGWKLKGLPQKPLSTVGFSAQPMIEQKARTSVISSQEEAFFPSSSSCSSRNGMTRKAVPNVIERQPVVLETDTIPSSSGYAQPPHQRGNRMSTSLQEILQAKQSQSTKQQLPLPPHKMSHNNNNNSNNNTTATAPPLPPPPAPHNPFAKYSQAPPTNSSSSSSATTNVTSSLPCSSAPPIVSYPSPPGMLLTSQQYAEILQQNEATIVDTVLRELVSIDSTVTFQDIAALDQAKKVLYESIVLPTLMPQFFTGIRQPWKGILLFGPPGTGKTMLAKAVCNLKNAKFFNCSIAFLTSKYRGDSEKIIKCLFQVAKYASPAVIFMDEIDALVSSRMDNGEHEASRRFKTELFTQIDGLNSINDHNIVVLAASNCPWDLDPAMRRRLEKRIFIPLPNYEARVSLLELLLRSIAVDTEVSIPKLAEISEGYSGSDLHVACRDAAMMPMRRLLEDFPPELLTSMQANGNLEIPSLTMDDFYQAFANTKPSVSAQSISRYLAWEQEFSNK